MNVRTKHIIRSRIRRAIRWEFWPAPIFYIPMLFYIFFLALRFKGLTFLSVNPGLPMSGLFGERKSDLLHQLGGSPFLAQFELLEENESVEQRIAETKAIMSRLKLSFPVVLKPDFGQRGSGVSIIRSLDELHRYLRLTTTKVLVQEYVSGEEFGVFYIRHPESDQSQIFSITEKTFPVVYGDGLQTLEQLLMANPRTHYMAEFLLALHADKLGLILDNGEAFKVVEIGSHCRGSVFFDGNHYISPQLLEAIDSISRKVEGFNFGRYDIRVENTSLLSAGEKFKILEVNGVTSESSNIYDPKNSVFRAYKILCQQWFHAFKIGRQLIDQGEKKVSIIDFFIYLKETFLKYPVVK